MGINLQLPKLTELKPRIIVIGVGGAGGNAVNNMIASGLRGVGYVVANTDAQALAKSSAERKIQLGVNLTEGLGAGSRPEIGEAAAVEAADELKAIMSGAHMVFIGAGMGGGTGTGAAGVIARIAKEELGILTVAIVTKPFSFEGVRRMRVAEAGIAEIRPHVDTLIVIPNQNLFRVANERTTFAEAFLLADQVLYAGISCIVDLIVKEGLINLDFADVRTVMGGMGTAMMGTGEASGERRASIAAQEAIANPLLDEASLKGARGVLVSIMGGKGMTLFEVDEAASRVREEVDPEANIIVGATFDDSLGDRVRVSIVAAGLRSSEATRAAPGGSGGVGGGSRSSPAAESAHPPRLPPQKAKAKAEPEDELDREIKAAKASASSDPGAMPPPAPPRAERETWRTSDGVTIETGLPARGDEDPSVPMPSLSAALAPRAESQPPRVPGFTPAPPADLSRRSRPMPNVEDFPPLAQQEFHAKQGSPSPPPASAQDAPSAKAADGGSPRRIRGLLDRFALREGRSRGSSSS